MVEPLGGALTRSEIIPLDEILQQAHINLKIDRRLLT